MRYHNITKDDMLNGDGLRVVLWVAGCSHRCKGCQNPITWDPECGVLFDEAAKEEIFTELAKDYNSGITFSGGDPLHIANIHDVTKLAKKIREKFPNSISIFIVPSSLAELENQIRGRRKEEEEVVKERMDKARSELNLISNYKFVVNNDDTDLASELCSLIIKRYLDRAD